MLDREDDAPLVRAAIAGDADAFGVLFDRWFDRTFDVAFRIVRNRDAAEDVLQEAFLTIWRGAGSYRASLSPPMAWMGLIVRSRALDALRKRTTDRADGLPSDADQADAAKPTGSINYAG